MKQLKLELGDVTEKNMRQLQILNEATFPISYHGRFYEDILRDLTFTRLGFTTDVPCCSICCRIEKRPDCPPEDSRTKRLYIMTLNVLPAYRRRGLATQLLDFVYKTLRNHPERDELYDIYLHAHTPNTSAREFYKSHQFVEKEVVKGYYESLEPSDSVILSREISTISKIYDDAT